MAVLPEQHGLLPMDIHAVALYIFPKLLIVAVKTVVIVKDKTVRVQDGNQISGSPEEKFLVIDHSDVVIVAKRPVYVGAGQKNVGHFAKHHMCFIDPGTMRDPQRLESVGHGFCKISIGESTPVAPQRKIARQDTDQIYFRVCEQKSQMYMEAGVGSQKLIVIHTNDKGCLNLGQRSIESTT